MNQVTIQFYGELEELAGTREYTLTGTGTLQELKNTITRLFPPIGKRNYIVAINNRITQANVILEDKCRIALMPPFSGG